MTLTPFGLDRLVGHRQVAVAAALGGEIDHDRSRLHRRDHVRGPELGGLPAGDQRGGDDDVDVGGELAELGELLLAELRGGRRRVAAGGGAVLRPLELEEHELGAHGFDLLGDLGAHVEGADDGAERDRGADGGEAGDAGAYHEHLGGRDLAGGGDLAGEEAAEVVAGLDDRPVAGDVRHRAQRVHLLGAADAGHHVHGDGGDALALERLEQLGVLGGVDEADQDLALAGALDLDGLGGAHLGDDVGLLPELGGGFHHLDAGFAVGVVREAGGVAGPGFDDAVVTELLQRLGGLGGQGHPLLAVEDLLGGTDLHGGSLPLLRRRPAGRGPCPGHYLARASARCRFRVRRCQTRDFPGKARSTSAVRRIGTW